MTETSERQSEQYYMKPVHLSIWNALRKHYRLINRGILFLISLGLIALLSQGDVRFRYEYHKGKPWLHNDLIAPFDFPVYKTKQDIESEKNAKLENLTPFYKTDEAITALSTSNFNIFFNDAWLDRKNSADSAHMKKLLTSGEQILEELLNTGVISLYEPHREKGLKQFYLLRGADARLFHLDTIHTIQSANEAIAEKLSHLPEKDIAFLQPILQNSLNINIVYDSKTTEKNRQQAIADISLTHGLIQNGEKIISKGELVSAEKYQIIESLKIEHQKLLGDSYRYYFIILGQIIIASVLLLVVFLFIYNFRRNIFDNNKKLFFIIVQMLMMVIITKIIVGYDVNLLYAIPVCITPIIIRVFFDTRLAIFIHVVTVIVISSFAPNSYEFLLYHLIAGIVAVLSIIHMNRRAQLFFTTFYIFATYVIFNIGLLLVFDGSLINFNPNLIGQFAVSAVLNLLAFPMIFLYEKLFGYVTDFSLMELGNTNNPLLRELATKAPGTFQHSIQVANMAEEAVYACGGNPLLVRTGALYHDIGKIDNPHYFTENQAGKINPHHDLTYKESAQIITGHVIKGIKIAKKHRLPEFIIDFIRTHHGTRKATYFYNLQLNSSKNAINDEDFSYKGPLPFSKETAILMMADAVEAASKALKSHEDDDISRLVDDIINGQIQEKQLENSNLSFKEINIIKDVFKKKLRNIYHARIAYPVAKK